MPRISSDLELIADPKWRVYEKVVADLEQSYPNCSVVHDHTVVGRYSGVSRQVDIWISGMIGRHSMTVAVDCKCYADPVDVKGVEEFIGMLDDVAADKGALVSTSGFTAAAERRAKAAKIDVRTISLEDLEDFDFAQYASEVCRTPGCWGQVTWDSMLSADAGGAEPPHHVGGRCDYCGAFHIMCGDCGEVDAYESDVDGIIQCSGCETRWQIELEKDMIIRFDAVCEDDQYED